MIISIDIETTGLDPETCQILEIGAYCDRGQFHCYVDNGLIQGEPDALHMNHGILKQIVECKTCIDPDVIAREFTKWLETVVCREVTIAGKNFGSFDKAFLDKLLGWSRMANKYFNYRYVDIGNLYWVPSMDGDTLPNLKTCMRRANFMGNVPHTALEDAIIVHKLVQHWKGKKHCI